MRISVDSRQIGFRLYDMTIPARLQLVEFLKEHNISQRAVATALRTHQPTFNTWVRGVKQPSAKYQWLIFLLAGIAPADWFVEEREKDWSQQVEGLNEVIRELRPTARRRANERISNIPTERWTEEGS